MRKYRLRIEGVNHAWFISDTDDLSTVRGGGLLILRVTAVNNDGILDSTQLPLGFIPGIAEVSTGASAGLYEFAAMCDQVAATYVDNLKSRFKTHPDYRHAVIVADAVVADASFEVDRESLIALNRWQQMATPTFAPDQAASTATRACAYDGVRPATSMVVRATGKVDVSESTKARFDFGREEKKRRFYEITAPPPNGQAAWGDFTNDFNELSTLSRMDGLSGKIAVIYADGNDFGKVQRDAAGTPDGLKGWDQALKKFRQEFLSRVLMTMQDSLAPHNEPDQWHFSRSTENDNPRKRIEVLMWGGDEFLLVVPAWQGWALVNDFLAHPFTYRQQRMTHSLGVVFCHNNTPIRQVSSLAHSLSDFAKRTGKERPLDTRFEGKDLIAYQILESFDHVGGDVARFMETRVGADNAPDLLLTEDAAASLPKLFSKITSIVPRRKAHQLAQAAVSEACGGQKDRIALEWKALGRSAGRPAQELIHQLDLAIRGQSPSPVNDTKGTSIQEPSPATLVHLVELWDYAAPPGIKYAADKRESNP